MKPVGLSMAGRAVDGLGWAERAYRAHLEDAELAAASAALPRTWTTLCLRQSEWIARHPANARRWCAEAVRRARVHGHVMPLNPGPNGLAMAAALPGDISAAERAATEARRHPQLGVYTKLDALAGATFGSHATRYCPGLADGRATAAAASRVAAVRETQRAAGPRAASAVMMAGEIARLKPVDS